MSDGRSSRVVLAALATTFALAACGGGSPTPADGTASQPTHVAAPSRPSPTQRKPLARPSLPRPRKSSTRAVRPTPSPRTVAAKPSAPVIVVDPGHSVTVHATDPSTGLDVSDFANEPEMTDVYAVALLVRARLRADGYRVLITKSALDAPTSLLQRAETANRAHAALALSIHDQAGSDGGVGFDQGNNVVYYQSVGSYRETPRGRRVTFTDSAVAALSKRYGEIFQRQRAAAQSTSVTLLGTTGYDLGSRGLPPGDIWLVQLLSHVPWIYNEAGGNSRGMVGLSAADEARYAAGLVAAVEACVPIKR